MNADAAGMNVFKIPQLLHSRTSRARLWFGMTQLCHYCTQFLPAEARGAEIVLSRYAVVTITLPRSLGCETRLARLLKVIAPPPPFMCGRAFWRLVNQARRHRRGSTNQLLVPTAQLTQDLFDLPPPAPSEFRVTT